MSRSDLATPIRVTRQAENLVWAQLHTAHVPNCCLGLSGWAVIQRFLAQLLDSNKDYFFPNISQSLDSSNWCTGPMVGLEILE
jgi:hypothetical protein